MTCRGDRRSPQGGHHAGKSNAADGKKDPQIRNAFEEAIDIDRLLATAA